MICVSIAQESHHLAYVDMLNAKSQCDLIEIRLDKFEKSPDVKELLENCPKPAIVSCRRVEDGGNWTGGEPARLTLLRQAVLCKAAYVEIELDCADQIRRYGETKRIISYTNTREVPEDIESIYQQACSKDPDVVKITAPARNPVEAFPLIKIIAKGNTPTVAVGWGRHSLMLNVLGQRYKAPWTFAALEKGMEAYPGMATIAELNDIYDFNNIDSRTPLLAVSGFAEEQLMMARVLNHGFKLAGNKTRCLPLEMGKIDLFQKVAMVIRLAGVLVDETQREKIVPVLTETEESVQVAGAADFVAITGEKCEKWRGFNALYRAVRSCLEDAIKARSGQENPLAGRTFLIVGCSGTARAIAHSLRKRDASIIMADKDEARARKIAAEIGGRCVPAGLVYTTLTDGMILCKSDIKPEPGKASIEIPKSCAREGMIAVDLTRVPYNTPFLDEVRALRGVVVRPIDIFLRLLQQTLKAYTGQTLTMEQLGEPLKDYDFSTPVTATT